MDIIGSIKRRTREEWIQLFREKWLDLRIIVQENGEAALVAGILGGIIFVLAFRFFIALAVIGMLVVFLILNIAESEKEIASSAKNSSPSSGSVPSQEGSSQEVAPIVISEENTVNGSAKAPTGSKPPASIDEPL
ncbi:MAG: hypothetical protein J5J00_13775 [Deltaproteobacteria bacterium]|nr:hypothetical protein [Deltaproteobacteria bacterium]